MNRAVLLKLEEEYIAGVCETIAAHKPDVVITEKGLSDLAMHYLTKVMLKKFRVQVMLKLIKADF